MTAKVLVVDDERGIRVTFDIFLSDEGYQVTTAGDHSEAIARISETRFDLVFLDLILGDHTGMAILRELRQRDPFCPVVMISGAPREESDREAAGLGVFEYLSKPVVKDTLLAVTRRALSSKS